MRGEGIMKLFLFNYNALISYLFIGYLWCVTALGIVSVTELFEEDILIVFQEEKNATGKNYKKLANFHSK